MIGKFYNPIITVGSITGQTTTTTTTTEAPIPQWEPPVDWPEIETVANNEINLLVGEGQPIAFVISGSTYDVDWGDGNIISYNPSITTQYKHTYSGTTLNDGSKVWKVRIYNASNEITQFTIAKHNQTTKTQYSPVMASIFGTTGLTNMNNMFYTTSVTGSYQLKWCKISSMANVTTAINSFYNCQVLERIDLPASFGQTNNLTNFLRSCVTLKNIRNFPTSWGSAQSGTSMFNGNTCLNTVKLPTTWGNMVNISAMLSFCSTIDHITLPISWGNVLDISQLFASCGQLTSINLPSTWGNVTTCFQLFNSCSSLSSPTLPTSWGNVTDTSYMFAANNKLEDIILPSSWGNVTTCRDMFASSKVFSVNLPSSWGKIRIAERMFNAATNIETLTFPANWSGVTSCFLMCNGMTSLRSCYFGDNFGDVTICSSAFNQCYNLKEITLPTSWSGNTKCVTETSSMFNQCYSLDNIVLPTVSSSGLTVAGTMFGSTYSLYNIQNLDKLGSPKLATSFTTLYTDNQLDTNILEFNALVGRLELYGTVGNLIGITGIRLYNSGSTFTGGSPQINIVYSNVDKINMEILFNDLPQGLATKQISIVGSSGGTLYVNCTGTTTASGKTITMSNTSGVYPGMELYGSGCTSNRVCTFQDTGDTVTSTAHGLPNGQPLCFVAITSTTGIQINKKYFVVNSGTSTFQVSLTQGGSVIALTTNGTGTYHVVPKILTVNAGVSIVLDIPCSQSGTNALLRPDKLNKSIATLKGWDVKQW